MSIQSVCHAYRDASPNGKSEFPKALRLVQVPILNGFEIHDLSTKKTAVGVPWVGTAGGGKLSPKAPKKQQKPPLPPEPHRYILLLRFIYVAIDMP